MSSLIALICLFPDRNKNFTIELQNKMNWNNSCLLYFTSKSVESCSINAELYIKHILYLTFSLNYTIFYLMFDFSIWLQSVFLATSMLNSGDSSLPNCSINPFFALKILIGATGRALWFKLPLLLCFTTISNSILEFDLKS